ncbi:tetratricopeptide repeat family protein, putative [Plasmodium malariae]|uniref:Tetratricopeptide repeat family protein, putative n=1 Tax=Plasmodium malariae TaxID=5858 RepID=A0A1C3KFA1_PLAMA|nr:tetratricopeptide repeat family protein, putative [Plasmodium malariae]
MDVFNLKNVDAEKIEEIKKEGNALFRNKQYKEALSVYRNVISLLCNGSFDLYKIKNVVKFFQEQCVNKINGIKSTEEMGKEANKDLSGVENVKSLFIKVCHNISLCYYFLEDFKRCIEYCSYINDIDKDHFKSYHTMGLCYEKIGDYKKCITYFDRCKAVLTEDKSNDNGSTSNKNEINRINEKLKMIVKLAEDNKNDHTTNIDTVKGVLLDENSSEEKKIKMLYSICNHKFYILLKENIFKLLYDMLHRSSSTIRIEKTCLYVIYKLISKLETENSKIDKDKIENGKNTKICINKLDDLKFQYYYDVDFVKMLISFNEVFDITWIHNYINNKIKIIEKTLKFSKEDQHVYKSTIDMVVYIINIIKYVHVINNDTILKIINLYYLNSDNYEIASSGLNALIFLCKKKKCFIQRSIDKKKKREKKTNGTQKNEANGSEPKKNKTNESEPENKEMDFLQILEKNHNININNTIVDLHFSHCSKYPVCVNSEIKKIIQNVISMYDNSSDDVEYALILLFTLLYDKNRPSEKDTEMNDLIYENVNTYFQTDEICVEWFICVKCLFLVDKNIVLNYLIGKTEYMFQILTFINNSIGRKSKKILSIYIDVLLLLLNISELRFMLNDYIDLYINILKTLNYDENFLKLLIGSFKLYMHNNDFKKEIGKNMDLFSYAKEMLKSFLLNYDMQLDDLNASGDNISPAKSYLTNDKREYPEERDKNNVATGERSSRARFVKEEVQENTVSKLKKASYSNPVDSAIIIEKAEKSQKNCELVDNKKKGKGNYNIRYDEAMLKDLIEMLFYLSLHIEFKKQLLEEKNNYILFFLIKVGDDINKKKLDNTYKYMYCNTINNLILTRTDEKMRRRAINKTNLSNFDNEQIEALEQFYDKLPNAARPKTDPLYDYGDDETSNELISLLLYNEKYQKNFIEKDILSFASKCRYKNGTLINTIYNFINSNFFTTNIAESICDIISKFVKNTNNIGIVLVNNGLKTLLLASKHISNKKNCTLALSEIFIYTNPKLIHFYEAYDSLPLLIEQLNDDEELLVFKSLMAITNILTIDENIAIKAMQLHLWNKCFDILSSENDCLRSASLECICNLCSQSNVHQYVYEKYQKLVKKNEDNDKEINFVDIQILFAFSMEYENYKAVFASTGALGMLSSDLRLPFFLIRTKSCNLIFSSFEKTDDQNILLRILTFFNNVILCEQIPTDIVKKIKDIVREKNGLNEENSQIANLILQ